MSNTSYSVPYQIGTYLLKNENGKENIDEVYKYIIDRNNVYAILLLDVLGDTPRESISISLERLINEWKTIDKDLILSENSENSKEKNLSKQLIRKIQTKIVVPPNEYK